MSRINDLYDRTEFFGHTAGTSTLKDDGSTASLTPPTFGTNTASSRLARTVNTTDATSREYGAAVQEGDLWDRSSGFGHSAGDPDDTMSAPDLTANSAALTYTGSNSVLTTTSNEADASHRTADVPTQTERQHASIEDRTSGYGHTAGSVSALHD